MDNDYSFKAVYERERKARLRAEELLENKTREIYHINEQLKMNAQALAQSNDALTQFAFVASHDLKEPLRKIKTFSNFLLDEYSNVLPEEGKDYINRMHNAVDRMDALIEGLLHYSRITRTVEPPVQINLSALIKDIISDLSLRIEETQGQVIIIEPLPIINADLTQIRQLVQNLIGNSLKFHQKGKPPIVTIAAKIVDTTIDGQTCAQCELLVSDNGIGFDEKYSKKVFGIFQRLHGHSEYEGYGIGLAVCKRIVERHKGDISIKSTPNVGTTFTITLPIIQGNEENGSPIKKNSDFDGR